MKLTDEKRRRLEELARLRSHTDRRLSRALPVHSDTVTGAQALVEVLIAIAVPFAVIGVTAIERGCPRVRGF